MITAQDAQLLKQAIARGAATLAAGVKTWHVINEPDPASAVTFVNSPPPQGAGEAAFSNRPDGTVDVYYYL